MHSVNYTMNIIDYGNVDGGYYSSSRLQERQIILTFHVRKTRAYTIAENRNFLYSLFPQKEKIQLLYNNDIFVRSADEDKDMTLAIDGYVSDIECDPHSMDETFMVTLMCPNPYFYLLRSYTLSFTQSTNCFVFPFAIDSENGITFSDVVSSDTADLTVPDYSGLGLVETSCKFTWAGTDAVVSPDYIQIDHLINDVQQATFKYNNHTKGATDVIDMFPGERDVYELYNTTKHSKAADVDITVSSWFTLKPGINTIKFNHASEDSPLILTTKVLFMGV